MTINPTAGSPPMTWNAVQCTKTKAKVRRAEPETY